MTSLQQDVCAIMESLDGGSAHLRKLKLRTMTGQDLQDVLVAWATVAERQVADARFKLANRPVASVDDAATDTIVAREFSLPQNSLPAQPAACLRGNCGCGD